MIFIHKRLLYLQLFPLCYISLNIRMIWDNDDMMMGMLMLMRIMINEAQNGQRIVLEHVPKRVLESSIRYMPGISWLDVDWIWCINLFCILHLCLVQEKVVSLDLVRGSLIANVIKPCKACSFHILYAVIGNQEFLLPTHINEILILWLIRKVIITEHILVRLEWWETALKFHACNVSHHVGWCKACEKKKKSLPSAISQYFSELSTFW